MRTMPSLYNVNVDSSTSEVSELVSRQIDDLIDKKTVENDSLETLLQRSILDGLLNIVM